MKLTAFKEYVAVFSAVTVLAILGMSPRAGSFTLLDITLTIVISFIIGYSWLICGSDHEYLRYIENENKNKDQIPLA